MDAFRDSRVLVVGGAGFVGSNLVKQLLSCEADEVVVVDNLLSAERSNLPIGRALKFVEGSINEDRVLAGIDDSFDYAFHLATYHGNQSSMHDPLADHENNTLTSLKLFHHLRDFKRLKKVAYASAGCTVAKKTFDDVQATDEDAPVSLYLDSPYQISKIVGEFYANYFLMRNELPAVKLRFQNVYGPGEVLGAGQWRGTPATVWRNVTPTFVYRALKGLPLTVENGGVATRDFIYVDDLVNGLMLAAANGAPGGVFNLATGVETSIRELAQKITDLTGGTAATVATAKRAWDRSGKRYGSTEGAKAAIGFEAKVGIDEGLERTVAWTRENLPRIEQCIAQHQDHYDALGETLKASA